MWSNNWKIVRETEIEEEKEQNEWREGNERGGRGKEKIMKKR